MTRLELYAVLTLKLFAAAGFALILVEALMMISPERLPHV